MALLMPMCVENRTMWLKKSADVPEKLTNDLEKVHL